MSAALLLANHGHLPAQLGHVTQAVDIWTNRVLDVNYEAFDVQRRPVDEISV